MTFRPDASIMPGFPCFHGQNSTKHLQAPAIHTPLHRKHHNNTNHFHAEAIQEFLFHLELQVSAESPPQNHPYLLLHPDSLHLQDSPPFQNLPFHPEQLCRPNLLVHLEQFHLASLFLILLALLKDHSLLDHYSLLYPFLLLRP